MTTLSMERCESVDRALLNVVERSDHTERFGPWSVISCKNAKTENKTELHILKPTDSHLSTCDNYSHTPQAKLRVKSCCVIIDSAGDFNIIIYMYCSSCFSSLSDHNGVKRKFAFPL